MTCKCKPPDDRCSECKDFLPEQLNIQEKIDYIVTNFMQWIKMEMEDGCVWTRPDDISILCEDWNPCKSEDDFRQCLEKLMEDEESWKYFIDVLNIPREIEAWKAILLFSKSPIPQRFEALFQLVSTMNVNNILQE